jgi:hypothetical protein
MFNTLTINLSFVRCLGVEAAYLLFALLDRFKPEEGKYYEVNFIDISDDIAMGWGDSCPALETLIEAEIIAVKDSNVDFIKDITFLTESFDDILNAF